MAPVIRRRTFLATLGGAVALALPARAQQLTMPVIGLIDSDEHETNPNLLRAFRQGLKETGYVEGRDVGVEYRWSDGQYDRLPQLAADLVRRQVRVITTIDGSSSALAAKAATSTIPVVFRIGADPVELGLVASMNRPGGNVTGVTSLSVELGPKRLEALHELIPTASVFAFLVNPSSPFVDTISKDVLASAKTLGLRIHILQASTEGDLNSAFRAMVQLGVGGLVIGSDVFFNSRSAELAALTIRHALPAAYQYREFVAAGGLMSYGGGQEDSYRLAGVYTGRILKGEKPADLPVQQSTKIELSINLKTAKALGISVPLSMLGRADELIE
jgi:putative tryptophan/tyrosine transport system substrate-binding protein